jgi:hypothetical protein
MHPETQRSDAAFFLTMAIVSALLIFAGFAPSFYLKAVIHAPTPPLTQLTIVHGVVFTAWVALFITQTSLIAADRIALHRQLGILGAILFGAMVSLGYSVAITAARLGHTPPMGPPPLAFLALPLLGITATLILIARALLNRRRSDWHKRLMLAAMFTLTPPGTARIMVPLGQAANATWIALGVFEALLVVAMLYDYRTHKRVHPAYWFSLALAVVLHVAVWWAFSSPVWLSFAKAITGS